MYGKHSTKRKNLFIGNRNSLTQIFFLFIFSFKSQVFTQSNINNTRVE